VPKYNDPLLPDREKPEPTYRAPLLPALAVPVLSTTRPLTPDAPLSAVARSNEPLDVAVL
jgi:hypothetical protein